MKKIIDQIQASVKIIDMCNVYYIDYRQIEEIAYRQTDTHFFRSGLLRLESAFTQIS